MTRLFADDTSLSHASCDLVEIECFLNEDLEQKSQWTSFCLIIFSPIKPEVIIISTIFSGYTMNFAY